MLLIKQLEFDAYGRRFFDGASLSLGPTTKAGLVGLNGVGKSTLFKLILGHFQPTGGDITYPKLWRVGTVDQEIAASPQLLIDAVLERDQRRHNLLQSLETAPPEALAEIHDRLLAIGADRAPAKAAEILSGLGFSNSDLSRPIADFSGGWRMRAALAGVLLAEPELLLLDEPTNYLDLEGTLWLENRLKRYPHAALIISHDRDLLNRSVGAIVHVIGQKLDYYSGGYDAFEAARAEKARLNAALRTKIEAERAHLQSFVDRFRAKASKATQAQSRLKRLEKLPPVVATIEDQVSPFILPSPEKALSPPVVRLENVACGYGDTTILKRLNLRLDIEDRIGLLGVNGAGKSTFAKLLAGAISTQSGEYWKDNRLTVGWFHQHQIEALDATETPIDMMRRALPEDTEAKRRARLGSFGFTAEKAETCCADLSGGERARLLLNMVAMQAPHLLILDEPTNHLDIDSRRALLEAINDYRGAVLIIAHDRALLEMVADRFWLADNGTITPFEGDMDDYATHVLEKAKQATRVDAEVNKKEAAPINAKAQRQANAQARSQLAPLKKKTDDLMHKINILSDKIKHLEDKLSDPELYVKFPEKAITYGKEKSNLESDKGNYELMWLEAAEIYENAKIEAGI